MRFFFDKRLAVDVGREFGEYVITYSSDQGQVRADIFRKGGFYEAHVSFPTGLDAGRVTDTYVTALWNYAREQGFQDRFRIVLSQPV